MDRQLDEAPCGFVSFDDAGTIVSANTTLARWLGRSRASLPGTSIEALYAPGGAIFHQTHLVPLLKLRGEVSELYTALRGAEGEALPMLVNACRHALADGARTDCVLVPMRQRHSFEQALIRAREDAEAARDAKARFLSMMAHEVRTPLSAVIGLAHVLQQDLHGTLAPEQQEDVRLILKAGTDIDRLIAETLRYSRAAAGQDAVELQAVPVDDAFAAVESIMHARWEETGIRYERRCAPSAYAVLADPMRLHQVLLNLLANAANHTPAGGQVGLDCVVAAGQDKMRIEVHDTGCGIAQDQLARIFEPFFQIGRAKRAMGHRGTGLGLAISREFALAMQGTLEARSTPGEGSVFALTLPLAT
jgi:signal transduction histidine kinase